MSRLFVSILLATVSLLLSLPVTAQTQQRGGAEEVIMLEEITIKVEPELPTVTVTISRQSPAIQTGELKRPTDRLLLDEVGAIKPRQTETTVSRIEDPRKLLAKPRSQ